MNYKKNSLLLSIILIVTIQILLLINNQQKSSFRYFIWNIQEVSIGRLISISFITGLIMSSVLNKIIINENKDIDINEEQEKEKGKEYSINEEDYNEPFEIPPQRDMRDAQPTISVNYRVIKNSRDNELKNKNENSNNPIYLDDWNNKKSEW